MLTIGNYLLLKTPTMRLSAIIPVYNQANDIGASLTSLLDQADALMEIIIVNDGSDDDARALLDSFAQEYDLITLIHQHNQGITKALIRGCEQARGDFIVRQDIGDLSGPYRLERQLAAIRANKNAIMCSTGTDYYSAKGEWVYSVNDSNEQLNQGLQPRYFNDMRGPSHHGTMMFSRAAYQQVGGYRASFKVAQDLDLWLRLATLGRHVTTGTIDYTAFLRADAISSVKRNQQETMRRLIFDCYQARANGNNDKHLIGQINARLSRRDQAKPEYKANTHYDYFIGSMLFRQKDPAAKAYLRAALKQYPFNLKAWVKYLWCSCWCEGRRR